MRQSRRPPWQVFLIGGASGTGKTSVSYQVAHHFGVGITEVDDFQVVLSLMTSPEEQPILHRCWSDEANDLPAEQVLELQIAVGEQMTPALEAVVANHIATDTPIVLEGDYILPSLVDRLRRSATGRVCGVFLYEPDENRLVRNLVQRETVAQHQRKRARVSWLYGRWLKTEAERFGIPVLEARPWETTLERVCAIGRDSGLVR